MTMQTPNASYPSSSTFHLPIELIIEILSRSSVKSLLRFTAVCKTWKSLIKSPDFIYKHLKQYVLNPNLACNSLIVASNLVDDESNLRETCFRLENALCNPVEIDLSVLGQTEYLMVVGVCSGLICVSLSYYSCDLAIYNTATRHFNRIPPCEQWNVDCFEGGRVIFGFGLHPSANDYKLVRITHSYDLSDELFHRAEIYSINSNDWKVIDLDMSFVGEADSPLPTIVIEADAVINGVLYWCANRKPMNDAVIVSFDMNDEVFGFVKAPHCCESKGLTSRVIPLKDEVAIIMQYYDKASFDVWVLNVDTRCWSLKFEVVLLPTIQFGEIYVTGSVQNGDIVFEDLGIDDRKQYVYDAGRRKIKRLRFSDIDKRYRSYCYVESLLPVTSNNR